MHELTYSNAVDYLLQSLPEFRPYYDDRARELYAFDNPHVVYGSILVEYIESIARGLAEQFNKPNDQLIRSTFAIIENLSSSHDFEVRCLIETGFLEALLKGKGDLKRFSPYMGLATRELARQVTQG